MNIRSEIQMGLANAFAKIGHLEGTKRIIQKYLWYRTEIRRNQETPCLKICLFIIYLFYLTITLSQ